mgnify:FL=1
MAIVNRDKDASEQKDVINVSLGALATSVTKQVAVLPYPCTLVGLRASALGVSNAMQVAMQVNRFIAGTGATAINLGISNLVLVNVGTSGVQGFSGLAAVGSTLLALQAGDVLQVVTSVANGNTTDLCMNFIVKKTQDIVSLNGSSA